VVNEPVLVRREGALGRLTLNRPAQLNAIDLPMVRAIAVALDAWEHDDRVAAVLLDGAGTRGLCAGGDVRFLYDDAARGGHGFAVLLAEEYRLDARIARYPKPYVALMDGVVMGGGVGVSAHGSVRVVTERTVLAMPEVSIGYVPDVGGTYLLARAPGELGTHAALSGARLNGADAIACGLADVLVPSAELPELTATLASAHERHSRPHPLDEGAVRAVVTARAVDPGPSALAGDRAWIDACYAGDDVAGIVERLRAGGHGDTADRIVAQSPIALVLTLRALRAAGGLDLEQCLEQEYVLTRAAVRWPDFTEGVRTRLVDRAGVPRWHPPTLAGVTDEVVAEFLRGARPDDPPLALRTP
jgi:enoyl-CoA hydratase